jgi:hypothetical protein
LAGTARKGQSNERGGSCTEIRRKRNDREQIKKKKLIQIRQLDEAVKKREEEKGGRGKKKQLM